MGETCSRCWTSGRGRLEPGELVWMAGQLGRALDAAHKRGIVHRDLKPSNVFVAEDEEGQPIVKLCDFGIAKLTGRRAPASTDRGGRHAPGALLGTPMYLAPELLRGAARRVARHRSVVAGAGGVPRARRHRIFRSRPGRSGAGAGDRDRTDAAAVRAGAARRIFARVRPLVPALVRARAGRPVSRRRGAGRGAGGRSRQPAAGSAGPRRRGAATAGAPCGGHGSHRRGEAARPIGCDGRATLRRAPRLHRRRDVVGAGRARLDRHPLERRRRRRKN